VHLLFAGKYGDYDALCGFVAAAVWLPHQSLSVAKLIFDFYDASRVFMHDYMYKVCIDEHFLDKSDVQ